MKVIKLDVSELPAPEPFQRIMEILLGMTSGEYLKVVHRKQPLLLYKPLSQQGFSYHVQKAAPTQKSERPLFEIFIWRGAQLPPEELVQPNLAAAYSQSDKPPINCGDH